MQYALVRDCGKRMLAVLALFAGTAAGTSLAADDTQPLQFEEALLVAEQHSARLAAQIAALDAAAEQVPRASELPDPKLRFGIDNLPVSNPDAFSLTRDFMTMRRIGWMQEMPNSDKRQARGERAQRERKLEAATLQAQRAQLRQAVALAWFELHFALRSGEALDRLEAAFKQESETTGPAVAAGRMAASAAVGARAAVESVRDRILEQRRMTERARAALAALVGVAAERPLGPAPDVGRLAHAPSALISDIETHAEQRVLEARESLAASEVALAASTRKPDWSWEVSFGQREPNFSNMVSVMVSMDLPIAKSARQDRDVATRAKQLEQARAQREDARRMHEAEVRGFIADWKIAAERVQRFDTHLLPLARERAELTLASYRGGRAELSSVLESRRAETELLLTRLGAALERARAWAKLNYLLEHQVKP